MLNLKRLQYLDAVYQYKNFTQASEALYVSQPAISSAVQALEEELGVRLVVRSSKGVTFTYEGEQFMIWARRILSTCEAAENAMRDLAGTAEQRLRLGISHVLTNPIVPMIFSTFLREHPKAQIYLNEGSMNKHVEMVTGNAERRDSGGPGGGGAGDHSYGHYGDPRGAASGPSPGAARPDPPGAAGGGEAHYDGRPIQGEGVDEPGV